ncbi:MAG: FAD-binding oxidoreductase, partial [Elusimicrobiota bacterium]|nr:FAD-binding oxidoreductase [Elusimicrobiota bacterium]
ENENEIPNFLLQAAKTSTPITVAAGLTANTGAGLAFGGAVLSLEKLNSISDVKIAENGRHFIDVQAGARLSDIKQKVLAQNFMYPPDPTEQNSTIGGNISTNASGARGFKFGPTRNYVKALTIVFTDGSIAEIQRGQNFADANGNISFASSKGIKHITLPKYKLPEIKNSAAYFNHPFCDVIDVFIGSEGTLGVITNISLFVLPKYKNIFSGIIFFNDENTLFNFADDIKNKKNNINALALEYFDKNTLDFIRDDYLQVPNSCQALMFEQDIYTGDDEDEILQKWTDLIDSYGINFEDVWFAGDLTQTQKLRDFRHKIPQKTNEIVHKTGIRKVGSDFAVEQKYIKQIIDFCHSEFHKSNLLNLIFGHIGENHLHANIIAKTKDEFLYAQEIYKTIVQKAISFGGTVSAEHGIGKTRLIFLEQMLGTNALIEMAKLKKSLDPAAILGRGNIFSKELLDRV